MRRVMAACVLLFAVAIVAVWYLGHSGRSPVGSTIAGGLAGLAIAVAMPIAVEMKRERRR